MKNTCLSYLLQTVSTSTRIFFAGLLAWVVAGSAEAACHNYGTLASDSTRATQIFQAGVRLATLEIGWDNYEPAEGAFNATYRDQMRARIQTFKNAGVGIVLDLGLQYPPAWIFNYPNSRFKNQFGTLFADPG